MDGKTKGMVSKGAGILIILLDLYWIYTGPGFGTSMFAIVGYIILLLSLVWLWADM